MFEKVVSRTDPLPLVESQVVAYPQARIPVFKKEKKPPVADNIVLGLNGKALDQSVQVQTLTPLLTGCMTWMAVLQSL